MSLANAEVLSSVLLLPESIAIEAVYPSKTQLTVQIVCILESATCPLCQQSSERIHSRYGRRVADVPCGGRRVILALTVRKFVCSTPTCPRKLFTERLPDLVQSYARMTNRLSEHLQTLGFATCGQLGERLAPKLGMGVSGPTLLRRMKTVSLPPVARVRVLGIDDWAWKKGQTYGTILVDLERRTTIDLLPDRSTETVVAWLRAHPEVEIVSRDRGTEYVAAAKKGAPQAQQIADRFHLLLNLREKLKELMARKQKYLPEIEAASSDAIADKVRGELPVLTSAHPDLERAYHLSQAFVSMLKERRDKDLDQWLIQAKRSGITELKSFAQGIGRDYDAVRAAFSSQWSQGQVEAQVNCLKLQKRIMFGRANFDFLRLRVLCRV